MTEPIKPCPACGRESTPYLGSAFIDYRPTPLSHDLDAENARAMQLLRATETLDRVITATWDRDASGSILLDETFIDQKLEWGDVEFGPLAAALIALADKVQS